MKIITLIALLLFSPIVALGQSRDLSVESFLYPDDSSSFIMLEKTAIGILPPETISGSYVEQAIFSPSGQYIVFTRRSNYVYQAAKALEDNQVAQIADEVSINIWDSKTRRSSFAWTAVKGEHLSSIDWLPGTNVAIAATNQTVPAPTPENPSETTERTTFLQINASTKKAVVILVRDGEHGLQLRISPSEPNAVIQSDVWMANKPPFFWLVGSAPIAEQIYLPEGAGGYNAHWLEGGKTPGFQIYSDKDGKTLPEPKWLTFDIATRTFSEWQEKESPKLSITDEEIKAISPASPLVSSVLDTKEPNSPKLNTLWYEFVDPAGKKNRLLVAGDSDLFSITPNKDLILYRAEGALFVRRLMTFPKEKVQAAMNQVQIAKCQTQAKQAGLAAIMCCNENSGTYPASDGFREKLLPYSRNKDDLDNFTYCLNGQKEKDIDYPSETMLGYVQGPGGYAVVFVDSHVKWMTTLPEQKNQ